MPPRGGKRASSRISRRTDSCVLRLVRLINAPENAIRVKNFSRHEIGRSGVVGSGKFCVRVHGVVSVAASRRKFRQFRNPYFIGVSA
jgi:hypothetical protein